MHGSSDPQLWELQQVDARHSTMVAGPAGCVGPPDHQMFMGGVATAAAIDAMERATGRPVNWASTQFLGRAMCGDPIDITVRLLREGRTKTQAVADLATSQGAVASVRAALGIGDAADLEQRFVAAPAVASPTECPLKDPGPWATPGNLLGVCERRIAAADPNRGLEDAWVRLGDSSSRRRADLAVIAEFIPGAHPDTQGGSGLDLTLRVFDTPPDAWTLLSTRMQRFGDGLYHASAEMFSTNGDHLASAGQTGRLPRST